MADPEKSQNSVGAQELKHMQRSRNTQKGRIHERKKDVPCSADVKAKQLADEKGRKQKR